MIARRTQTEIERIRKAGLLVAEVLDKVEQAIRSGVTTGELDEIAERFIRGAGATPTFKGYQGFPATLCTSVNEEVVHGIPGTRTLKEGDIVGIDVGVTLAGYIADAAKTFPVGKVPREAEALLAITREALAAGIQQCRLGKHVSDIGHAIQETAEGHGYAVVRRYVGHGVGRRMHEDPQIPNYGPPDQGPELKPGMVFAIEPMVNIGGYAVTVLEDNWTVVTVDRKRSAHFEHTVAVTSGDPDIMTLLGAEAKRHHG